MRTVLLSKDLSASIKKSRGRTLRIAIRPGGAVELTLPYFVSYKRGLKFLQSKHSWILEKRKVMSQVPLSFLRQGNRKEYEALREQAANSIKARVDTLRGVYKVTPKKIVIRHQKSRWGSCSRKGTLSFSYRISLLPQHLRDYIIVHELCHLREFNHSKNFWSLVALQFPDYKKLRKELNNMR